MVLVVIITSFTTLLSVVLINQVRSESNRGAHATWSQASFQAAEAGVDDYVSKLVDDHGFYLHYVHPAESTVSPSAGVNAPHSADCSAPDYSAKTSLGVAWGYSRTWTYPSSKYHWCQLANGYYYNLQVFPPGSSGNPTTSVRLVGTGRRSMSSTEDMRALESYVRPSNLADFYRFSDGNVSIDAETFGKITRTGTSTTRDVAHADIFTEGSITGARRRRTGRRLRRTAAFPTNKIKNHPIDFSKFLVSLVDIKRRGTPAAPTWTRPVRPVGIFRLQLERDLLLPHRAPARTPRTPWRRRCDGPLHRYRFRRTEPSTRT